MVIYQVLALLVVGPTKCMDGLVIVQLLDLDLPVDLVLWTVLNCNGQVSAVIEEAEFTDGNLPSANGTSLWYLNWWSRPG